MPIVPSVVANIHRTSDYASSYVTPSYTIPDNCLIVVFVRTGTGGTTSSNFLTVSGGGYSWTIEQDFLDNRTYDAAVAMAWAPAVVGGSHSFTIGYTDGGDQPNIGIMTFTGVNLLDPVGHSFRVSYKATSGTFAFTERTVAMGASPELKQYAVVGIGSDTSNINGIDQGTGWTEILYNNTDTFLCALVQGRESSVSSDTSFYMEINATPDDSYAIAGMFLNPEPKGTSFGTIYY